MHLQPAVFLDRDNTLIQNEGDLGEPDRVQLVDGIAPGLKSLRERGFRLVVVTNQAGVARGKFSEEDVDAVHQRIALMVDEHARTENVIDRFYYCPYHPEATVAEYRRDHPWRKPHPGMILQAARDMGLDLAGSWMIGDQERDVEAGRAAGCQTILVTRDAAMAQRTKPTQVFATFLDAVEYIVSHAPAAAPASALAVEASGGQSGAGTAVLGNHLRRSSIDDHLPPRLLAHKDAVADRSAGAASDAGLRHALTDLAEEIRSDRLRRSEFTVLRMIAGIGQLLALLLAVLGLMQLDNLDAFLKWMAGAVLVQLLTMTLLILDLKS